MSQASGEAFLQRTLRARDENKNATSVKEKQKRGGGRGTVSDLEGSTSDGQSHLGVAARVCVWVCVNVRCPHMKVPHKRGRCETSARRPSAGRFGRLKSSAQLGGRVGVFFF